ncbi:MAG: hypothetical protein K0Q63_3239, partial [Paenibacillus sp.]|nr:hypothetical protein [Paenibacillus sp.]
MNFWGQWPIKSIRGQFLTAFLLCIAIPITGIFYYYYASTEKLLIKEVDRSYLQLLSNDVSAMTELTERMLYAADLIANDPEVLEFLKMDTSWLSDYYALQKYKMFNRRLSNTGTFMLDGRAVIDVIDTRGYLFSNVLLDDAPRTLDRIVGYGWKDNPLVKEGYPLWLTAKAGDLDLMSVSPSEEMLVLVK